MIIGGLMWNSYAFSVMYYSIDVISLRGLVMVINDGPCCSVSSLSISGVSRDFHVNTHNYPAPQGLHAV